MDTISLSTPFDNLSKPQEWASSKDPIAQVYHSVNSLTENYEGNGRVDMILTEPPRSYRGANRFVNYQKSFKTRGESELSDDAYLANMAGVLKGLAYNFLKPDGVMLVITTWEQHCQLVLHQAATVELREVVHVHPAPFVVHLDTSSKLIPRSKSDRSKPTTHAPPQSVT